jgi:hypothetical protein
MSQTEARHEHRDTAVPASWKRTQFELSLKSIAAFGFSSRVVEYCLQRARGTDRLPQDVAIEIVEEAVRVADRKADSNVPKW